MIIVVFVEYIYSRKQNITLRRGFVLPGNWYCCFLILLMNVVVVADAVADAVITVFPCMFYNWKQKHATHLPDNSHTFE